MTDEEQTTAWIDDDGRGVLALRHFFYCYVNHNDPSILDICIRLNCALDVSESIRIDCPLFECTWIHSMREDFRPYVWREIMGGIGLKPPTWDTYILCPLTLRRGNTDYLTNQKNTAQWMAPYWLPTPNLGWIHELR